MSLKIVGLFLLVIAASARHMRMKVVTRTIVSEPHAQPANPAHSFAGASWGSRSLCPGNSFARSIHEFQDWDVLPKDHHGLTQVKLYCRVPYQRNCDSATCKWIRSGESNIGILGLSDYGDIDKGIKTCPHERQFLTGIQPTFGGVDYGVFRMRGICDVPNWETTPEAKKGDAKPAVHKLRDTDDTSHIIIAGPGGSHDVDSMEVGAEKKCPSGTAICGITTKFDDQDHTEDDAGITEIKISCCTFPNWDEVGQPEKDNFRL